MGLGNHIRIGVIPTLNGAVNNNEPQRTKRAGRWERQRICVGHRICIGVISTLDGEVNNSRGS